MKRILALFLALLMALSLVGCGGKSSNVSLDDYEKSFLHTLDDDWNLTASEVNGGYSFSFTGKVFGNSFSPLTVEGTANKQQMVEQVTVTLGGVPEDYFQAQTPTSILLDITNYESVPMGRLAADCVIGAVATPMFADDIKALSLLEMILPAIDSPQTHNGWTYTMVLEGKTLTITSEYTG